MIDDKLSIIKPVESPQNTAGPTPAKRREQKKKRKNFQEQSEEESGEKLNESEYVQNGESEAGENQEDQPTIDYRA